MKIVILVTLAAAVQALDEDEILLARDYFMHKNIRYVCYFSCESQLNNMKVVKALTAMHIRTSVTRIESGIHTDITKILRQWNEDVGVLLHGSCDSLPGLLNQASKARLFDSTRRWVVFTPRYKNVTGFIEKYFEELNLSIDADITVASYDGTQFSLADVFNFGAVQGNSLEIISFGSWNPDKGLNVSTKSFKYYQRWNFHNLTLRAVSVILNSPEEFHPGLLSKDGYTTGVAAMTKISSQLLNVLSELHNFRFQYTIADRWIGSPKRNSTLAVTNSLYWGEQDISSTCARIFPQWLNWVDICFPPTANLQTKFYYLMPDKGIGEYENQFLTPMSAGVWWSTLAACILCAGVLGGAAWVERRPAPGWYAFFSVSAALFQQDFDDGLEGKRSSQGRKMTLLVVGLTSMLLYNYYTSSVVSWLLSAVPPTIDSLEQLMESNLELIFEDIGYTRGWLDNPGFYYFSGYTNPKEDELRENKVVKRKQTVNILQSAQTGVELMRTGSYAYHSEPYTANQVISRTFSEAELCDLGSLQMMQPAHVYIMVQKRSPYKEFFTWSLLRLYERGHTQATQRRFAGVMPACSGIKPRALALGQAAPAFLVLLQLTMLALIILIGERMWHKFRTGSREFIQ